MAEVVVIEVAVAEVGSPPEAVLSVVALAAEAVVAIVAAAEEDAVVQGVVEEAREMAACSKPNKLHHCQHCSPSAPFSLNILLVCQCASYSAVWRSRASDWPLRLPICTLPT